MPLEIKMPQLGESVVEGTISRWLKKPGERVEKYEALLEVMTDKVDTEVPAPEAGVLSEIMVAEGETVRVGTLIALLDNIGAFERSSVGALERSSEERTKSEKQPTNDDRRPTTDEQRTMDNGQRTTTTPFVSPAVARLVAEHGVDLSMVSGTSQGGRVSKKDVLRYLEGRESERADDRRPTTDQEAKSEQQELLGDRLPSTVHHPPSARELPEDAELLPLSPMRRIIAERMEQSVREAPHVTTVIEVDMGATALHRTKHKAEFERQNVNLTFTAYFAQAVCVGLRAVPVVNASFTPQGIIQHQRIHLGVAVALDEGLIVPVIRDADEKNLLGLARAINDIAARARARRLRPEEAQDGTFTITNHGVSGSLFATPIINQPQGAILGIGAVQKRAVVITHNGVDALAIRPMCYLSLTFDHRLLDGATADSFLVAVKRTLEA